MALCNISPTGNYFILPSSYPSRALIGNVQFRIVFVFLWTPYAYSPILLFHQRSLSRTTKSFDNYGAGTLFKLSQNKCLQEAAQYSEYITEDDLGRHFSNESISGNIGTWDQRKKRGCLFGHRLLGIITGTYSEG